MSSEKNTYYVYVYIDPRSYQEFYYGKGKGSRMFSHLKDDRDTEKAKIIRQIKSEGLEPIIRVIATGLTEQEAFLVEKTLIWKLGKTLTNISSGHFAEKFRPHNTLHKDLHGFDYSNGVFYVNIGEGKTRNWDDCRKYGFLSAGQDWNKWGSKIHNLGVGDIVVAYLKNYGYVGVGRVSKSACPVNEFRFKGKALQEFELMEPNLYKASIEDSKKCEQLVAVEWINSVDRNESKWKAKAGLFSTQQVVASLANQPKTIQFLEKSFQVSFADELERSANKTADLAA